VKIKNNIYILIMRNGKFIFWCLLITLSILMFYIFCYHYSDCLGTILILLFGVVSIITGVMIALIKIKKHNIENENEDNFIMKGIVFIDEDFYYKLKDVFPSLKIESSCVYTLILNNRNIIIIRVKPDKVVLYDKVFGGYRMVNYKNYSELIAQIKDFSTCSVIPTLGITYMDKL